ncbi:hypothetical protein SESBI_03684 [Sesbania bispinosa]|nr:hypothetical protein SESBI_03684 [Sesbania bispinosa]
MGYFRTNTQGHDSLLAANHTECCMFNTEDYSHLSDSDDSISRPKPKKQGNLKRHHQDLKASGNYTSNAKTSIQVKPKMKFSKALKPWMNGDFVDSNETSLSLNSKKEDMELNEPFKNFLSSRDSHHPRPVIPLGPRFQAEVPKWEDTANIKHHNNEDLKWLGTQIWPMLVMSTKGIEKSRLNLCSREVHGSIHCVQKHINIETELLELEIGKSRSSWKFDDIGEDVSKSWTLKEQKDFESLIKLYLLSNDTSFWMLALEHFPSKSTKCLVSYYYNVYIPRCVRMKAFSSFGSVNDDKDHNENYKAEIECSSKENYCLQEISLVKESLKQGEDGVEDFVKSL